MVAVPAANVPFTGPAPETAQVAEILNPRGLVKDEA